jgi:O6-methylguanine-DNA--protein-cysteine methyltransferase
LSDDHQKILRFIKMPSEGLELPLDTRGTPFQQRVWDELLGIPRRVHRDLRALANRIREPVIDAPPTLRRRRHRGGNGGESET